MTFSNKTHMLKPETLEYLQKVAKDFGVKKLILFGSCLHKPEDEARDIDLAIEGIEGDFYQFGGKLMMSLNKLVDVVDLSWKAPINVYILSEGVVIYEERG